MESQRQKKIAGVLQKDLADILRLGIAEAGHKGTLLSVSKVQVTSDLSLARVYVSIFPYPQAESIMKDIEETKIAIRHELARRVRSQLRRVPDLYFHLDDSLEYINHIEKSLKEGEDPIENPELLARRKKM